MNNAESPPSALTGHKPCIPKRSRAAPLSDAAKALLSSPLPPELVVDFKGLALHAPTPPSSSSSSLRSSSSESNVNRASNRSTCDSESAAFRTLSDGGRQNVIRRLIESEDSSYDSDYECSYKLNSHTAAQAQRVASVTAAPLVQTNHDDAVRTVSDTLVSEFNDYSSIQGTLPESKEQYSDESDSDEGACQSYASRVEFAVKLGYTEMQVQKALAKLGPRTTQNELLAELIRLSALFGSLTNSTLTLTNSISPELKASAVHRSLASTLSDEGNSLRHIVIDGSNVAFSHGNKEIFSCRGIQLCVDWFKGRGHQEITVFVPRWRKEASKMDAPISNQEILLELEKDRMLVFTPSRQVGGRRLVCYDDRYILKLAAETDGIVVSNDNYRDLASENPCFRKIIEERILMYSFVNDRFMPPEDPLGRNGPKLGAFLRKNPRPCDTPLTVLPCPYDKKCTYGNKCKYYHPERGNLPQKSVTERLAEHQLLEAKSRVKKTSKDVFKTFSLPGSQDASKVPSPVKKTPLARTKSIIPSHVDVNELRRPPPPPTFNVPPPNLEKDWRHLSHKLSDSADDVMNHHPVVQRQLTLDPYGSDPRSFGTLAPPYPPPPIALHSLVTRNASAPVHSMTSSWTQYERVVEPHRAHRLNSTSDTQLNLCGNSSDLHNSMDWARSDPFDEVPAMQPIQQPHQQPNQQSNQQSNHQQHQWACRTASLPNQAQDREPNKTEIREKLYFHLAAIFPEEQVRQVMQRLPNETDAQKICAAILAFFPN